VAGLVGAAVAGAATLTASKKISEDAFSNPTSQHHSEVEPDTFAFGSTVLATFQEGRFFNGGASGIGFATSTNGGHDFGTKGTLPGLTVYSKPAGPNERASDTSVAYDSIHGVWLINTLALSGCGRRELHEPVHRRQPLDGRGEALRRNRLPRGDVRRAARGRLGPRQTTAAASRIGSTRSARP